MVSVPPDAVDIAVGWLSADRAFGLEAR